MFIVTPTSVFNDYLFWRNGIYKNGLIDRSFVDHLCLVFLMLSRLFIAALWSPAWKGLSSWLLLVMFIVVVFLL